jgi:hypothetical protein
MTVHSLTHCVAALLLVCLPWCSAQAQADKKDFSAAERLLFMSNQLGALKPPLTLRYSFRKSGSLEEGFEDKVSVALTAQPDGTCCAARGEFLGGARKLVLPELPSAEGNPVTLYFLERDIREMQRLTKGAPNHFRTRIRMALFEAATVRDVSLPYRGDTIAGKEIDISPYLDDPNRARFEKFARKQYVFTLSDAVPGGVYGIRSLIGEPDAALIVEEMLIDGAPVRKTTP